MKHWIYKPCAKNCFKDRFKCQRENQKQKKKNLEGILHLECTQAEVSNQTKTHILEYLGKKLTGCPS